ncbi:hypothetical protein [Pseudomonas sp. Irchel s3h9]|uniref:hypothetical protein n=1 Tax=Pseudomonas sp. Irchel s3h9 TaxID=2009192 RepID=UPI0015B315A2|nr:hypothetical protein [Pseudomonas sp. Irchel s3h9]
MTHSQTGNQSQTALLRSTSGIDTPLKNSLCCVAAGITAPSCSAAEVPTPHKKLREAAAPDATRNAHSRPPAQPVVGYTQANFNPKSPSQAAVNEVLIDERTEFENEFPVPEGLQYCAQRETYITAHGAKTSDSFAREHYAYRAGFAAWKRRAWKHAALVGQQQETEV